MKQTQRLSGNEFDANRARSSNTSVNATRNWKKLKKESDDASKKRLANLQEELADLREEANSMKKCNGKRKRRS